MITRSTHCPCPGRGCPIVDSPRRVPSCPCTNYTHYYSYDNYTIIKLNLHTPKRPARSQLEQGSARRTVSDLREMRQETKRMFQPPVSRMSKDALIRYVYMTAKHLA